MKIYSHLHSMKKLIILNLSPTNYMIGFTKASPVNAIKSSLNINHGLSPSKSIGLQL